MRLHLLCLETQSNSRMDDRIEKLKKVVQGYATELLGPKFTFRKGQLEATTYVVNNVISDTKQTILEAPTGSGKSIIAILAAYTLAKKFDKKTYILVSDLSLYAQYETDIKKLDSPMFGWIKGKENYKCKKNGGTASSSECSLDGLSPLKLMSPENKERYFCKHHCPYVQDYVRAVKAPITLMTYQLYFIQRNYVENDVFGGKNKNFPARDLVVCDECHNLCNICQQHFAPTIQISRPWYFDTLDDYFGLASTEAERSSIVDSFLPEHRVHMTRNITSFKV